MDLTDLLLADYNYYRFQTRSFHELVARGIPYLKPLEMKPERRVLLRQMVEWCRARGLEPRLWLYGLFKARAWYGSPKLEPGHLMSEKIIPKYEKMRGLGFFRKRTAATRLDEDGGHDPNRDLTPTVEAVKRVYQADGQARRCLEEVVVRTLGFHPASPVCRACPVADECAVRLQSYMPFDILALRLGQITAAEAERQARGG